MRVFLATMAGCLLATAAFGSQAKALSQTDRQTCGWGSQIAAEAQQAKLRHAQEAASAPVCQTLDAHDRHGHYRTDLQQPFTAQARCH